MFRKKINILVITPTNHITGLNKELNKIGNVKFIEDPTYKQVKKIIKNYDGLFTNPNKSKVCLDKNLLKLAIRLKVICTASTGTNHIDMKYAKKNKIKILCLKEDRSTINKISSTAEHAFALTLSSIRNIISSNQSVLNNEWDYTRFIGRQLNNLTFGIIGYGRLGKLYANYLRPFKANILVYDPYKKVNNKYVKQVNKIDYLLKASDVISLHVHLNNETNKIINKKKFNKMKKNVIIINTARGEIVNDKDLIYFLTNNKDAKYATDVLSNELSNIKNNSIIKFAKKSSQVLITPHIGGMTKEAQEIAFNHSAKKLSCFFTDFFIA